MRLRPMLCCAVVLLAGVLPVSAQDKEEAADALKLQASGLPTDGAGLLEFFRNRTRSHVAPEKLKGLIAKLGDKDKDERDKAVRELIGLGPLAVPSLRLLVSDPDGTVASKLGRRCLSILQGDTAADLPAAAARLLAQRHPKGTVEALLAYLPFADSDEVLDEVRRSLAEVSGADGKPDPALLKALQDSLPLRRAVALDVLAARGHAPKDAVRKLLSDSKPSVRLRAALVLAGEKDAKAVSMLIVLLAELPFNYAREAEDFLQALAAEQSPRVALAASADSRQKTRDAWAEWWLKSEKPGLLDEFRKRTMDEESRLKAQALIRDLHNDAFKVRDAASKKLGEMGVLVLPLLRHVAKEKDFEASSRAKTLIAQIEKTMKGPLSPVTARLVAFRKPEGSVSVLLKFLPFADDDSVAAEVQNALNVLAFVKGKPDPTLVAALADKLPLRRAAAAEALASAGTPKEMALVRQLLKDPVKSVRLRAALALAGQRDRGAVAVLIGLIGELPSEQSAPAEEFLSRLAGEATPAGNTGTDAGSREKRRDAWAKWWKDKGATVKLHRRSSLVSRGHSLGYTIVAEQYSSTARGGRVLEFDRSGKVRWEIRGLNYPWDARVVGRDRVLIAEYYGNKVSERDFKGNIKWSRYIPQPITCMRLRNGNTFVARRNQLYELDKTGKDVVSILRNSDYIMAAAKLRNGTYALVNSSNTYIVLDRTGKELKRVQLRIDPVGGSMYYSIQRNGGVLLGQYSARKVIEFNRDGKRIWEASVLWPYMPTKLPNGNVLVSSLSTNKVIELNRAGKTVRELTYPQLRPYRAQGR